MRAGPPCAGGTQRWAAATRYDRATSGMHAALQYRSFSLIVPHLISYRCAQSHVLLPARRKLVASRAPGVSWIASASACVLTAAAHQPLLTALALAATAARVAIILYQQVQLKGLCVQASIPGKRSAAAAFCLQQPLQAFHNVAKAGPGGGVLRPAIPAAAWGMVEGASYEHAGSSLVCTAHAHPWAQQEGIVPSRRKGDRLEAVGSAVWIFPPPLAVPLVRQADREAQQQKRRMQRQQRQRTS